jgi:hypothetical protein
MGLANPKFKADPFRLCKSTLHPRAAAAAAKAVCQIQALPMQSARPVQQAGGTDVNSSSVELRQSFSYHPTIHSTLTIGLFSLHCQTMEYKKENGKCHSVFPGSPRCRFAMQQNRRWLAIQESVKKVKRCLEFEFMQMKRARNCFFCRGSNVLTYSTTLPTSQLEAS